MGDGKLAGIEVRDGFFQAVQIIAKISLVERNGEFIVMRGNQALEVDVAHEAVGKFRREAADAAEQPVAVGTTHGGNMDVGGADVHYRLACNFDDE